MIISGQFNDSLAPIMDGVAVTAQNYAYWLNKKYSPSFAIGPKVPGYKDSQENILRFASVPLQRKGPYRLGLPSIDRSFNTKIETIPFDIVHAHCPFVSGSYAQTLAKKRNIPLVATFHSKYRDDFARWLPLDTPLDQLIKLIVQFYDNADAVWVPNEAIIDTLRSYGYKGPVEYVPNGSDIAAREGENREELVREGKKILSADDRSPLLLYVGQHRWVKNIRRIIEALKILHDMDMDFQMRFVGNGNDLPEMMNLVRKLGLTEKVRFIGPIYNREALRAIYGAADLFLFPSLYDNASLATREAAGLYLPTAFIEGATTANGIIDGVNGFLSLDTSEAFADRIRRILTDREALTLAGEGAYRDLYKSWEVIAGLVYDKYSQLIEEFKFTKLKKIS